MDQIKPTELRIGNYIEAGIPFNPETITYFKNSKVEEIGNIYVKLQNRLIPYEYVTPIPLTEDWLLQFGYVKDIKMYTHPSTMLFDLFNVTALDGGFKIVAGRYTPRSILIISDQIYYVHQLQNIYYHLTQKELILNKDDKR